MEDPPSRSGPPPIYIQQPPNHFDRARGADGNRPYASAFSPSFASVPKAIPGRYTTEDMTAPPPLPPPRFAPVNGLLEPGSSYNTPHHRRDESEESLRSFRSESSGFGSMDVDPPPFLRKQSDETVKPDRDEGYHSLASTLGSAPQKFFMSHNQYQLRPRENDYDNSLLKKFNAQPPRRSGLSMSASDAAPRHSPSENRLPSLLTSLPAATSLPMRPSQKHAIDSAGPVDSARSPRGGPLLGQAGHDYRSPVELGADRSPVFRARRQNSGSLPDDATVSTQGSYENADDADFHMDETAGIGRLHLGLKRRASSPPVDDLLAQGLPGTGELLRRREGASRSSPTPRLTVIPHGSMSSMSSTGRSASFASNGSLTATSLTSMNSMGRRSPGGFSPGGLSPIDSICNSPFNTPMTLGHSPRSSMSLAPPHHRSLSGDNRPLASPRKLTEVPKSSMARIQGFFMCECCPKKPKKFETAEELSAHEAEKQYECSFCGNRFKNKNEAERHQNSLHVRRHSWSCSALHVAGYDKAFHDSAARPGEFDTCGYCGDEFMRTGASSTGRSRQITEQDWDERLRHLQEVHKFRECNSSKKFYRADHFRQHLKHSHAGTSGKWTNMLESACMIEEEPPQMR